MPQPCRVQLCVCSFNLVMLYLTLSSRPLQARWLLLGVLAVATMGNSHSGHALDVMDAARDAAHPTEQTGESKKGKTAFEELDKDEDGRVTRKEFTVGSVGGADVAFSCLDADMNGYVTKEEQAKLKKAFYRSHLSQVCSPFARRPPCTSNDAHAAPASPPALPGLCVLPFAGCVVRACVGGCARAQGRRQARPFGTAVTAPMRTRCTKAGCAAARRHRRVWCPAAAANEQWRAAETRAA